MTLRRIDDLSVAESRRSAAMWRLRGDARGVLIIAVGRPAMVAAAAIPHTSDDALAAADDIVGAAWPVTDWRSRRSRTIHGLANSAARIAAGRASGGLVGDRTVGRVSTAADRTRNALAAVNRGVRVEVRAYLHRLRRGHPSAEQLLALARRRLENDPAAELRTAAGEQHQITRLRLRALLSEHS